MVQLKLHHLHHTTPNPKAAVEFYTQVLGAKIVRTMGTPEKPSYQIELGGLTMEVTTGSQADEPLKGKQAPKVAMRPQYGLHHVCFLVEDIIATIKELKSKGVQFLVEPKPGSISHAYIMGPDDILIQLNQASWNAEHNL